MVSFQFLDAALARFGPGVPHRQQHRSGLTSIKIHPDTAAAKQFVAKLHGSLDTYAIFRMVSEIHDSDGEDWEIDYTQDDNPSSLLGNGALTSNARGAAISVALHHSSDNEIDRPRSVFVRTASIPDEVTKPNIIVRGASEETAIWLIRDATWEQWETLQRHISTACGTDPDLDRGAFVRVPGYWDRSGGSWDDAVMVSAEYICEDEYTIDDFGIDHDEPIPTTGTEGVVEPKPKQEPKRKRRKPPPTISHGEPPKGHGVLPDDMAAWVSGICNEDIESILDDQHIAFLVRAYLSNKKKYLKAIVACQQYGIRDLVDDEVRKRAKAQEELVKNLEKRRRSKIKREGGGDDDDIQMNFKISQVIRILTRPRKYDVEIDGSWWLTDLKLSDIMNKNKFQEIYADEKGVIPKMPKTVTAWHNYLNTVLPYAKDSDPGEEGSEMGMAQIMITTWLNEWGICEEPRDLLNSMVYYDGKHHHVSFQALQDKLEQKKRGMPPQDLAPLLRRMGLSKDDIRKDGRKIRTWRFQRPFGEDIIEPPIQLRIARKDTEEPSA